MSKQITIRKALQVKKTLVGEIAQLRGLIVKYNSQKAENKHIDLTKVHADYVAKVESLIKLKTAITKANVGIYESIIMVEEVKGRIALLGSLDTSETEDKYVPATSEYVEVAKVVHLNLTQVNEKVTVLKAELETLLDKIDHFNSNTLIEVD
jgi:hypothetical protein